MENKTDATARNAMHAGRQRGTVVIDLFDFVGCVAVAVAATVVPSLDNYCELPTCSVPVKLYTIGYKTCLKHIQTMCSTEISPSLRKKCKNYFYI